MWNHQCNGGSLITGKDEIFPGTEEVGIQVQNPRDSVLLKAGWAARTQAQKN